MGKKAKINYIVDVIILILFVISAFSGLGLMKPKEERATTVVVDEQRAIISDVHILSSFVMVAGVIVHLVLHWRWMSVMSRKMMENHQQELDVVTSASIST